MQEVAHPCRCLQINTLQIIADCREMLRMAGNNRAWATLWATPLSWFPIPSRHGVVHHVKSGEQPRYTPAARFEDATYGLGYVRQSGSGPDSSESEQNRSPRTFGQSAVSHRDPAALLEPADEPLHDVASPVFVFVELQRRLRICAVAFLSMRNQRLATARANRGPRRRAVACFVARNRLETLARPARVGPILLT